MDFKLLGNNVTESAFLTFNLANPVLFKNKYVIVRNILK